MSIRRTIESLLGDEQQQEAFRASPEAFFAEHGVDGLPGELIGTAFVHYSDTAPIEHGDAVAGIATHYSAVPFESDDLPDISFDGSDGASPFTTLALLTGEELPGDGLSDLDDELPTESVPDTAAVLMDDDGESFDDPSLDGADPTTGDDAGVETTDAVADDGIDSAGFHDDSFDTGFSDGFDEAEALDDDAGFGDGGDHHAGPTEILGEIRGAGPSDPERDDPFFDDVTDDGLPTAPVAFEPIDFDHGNLQHEVDDHLADESGDDMAQDSFLDHHVDDFDDVDPSDLDLDDF